MCVVLRHFVIRDTVATASLEGGLGVRDTKLHGWSLFRQRNQLGSGLEMALRTSFYTPFCDAKSRAHSFFRRRHRFESGVENAIHVILYAFVTLHHVHAASLENGIGSALAS